MGGDVWGTTITVELGDPIPAKQPERIALNETADSTAYKGFDNAPKLQAAFKKAGACATGSGIQVQDVSVLLSGSPYEVKVGEALMDANRKIPEPIPAETQKFINALPPCKP